MSKKTKRPLAFDESDNYVPTTKKKKKRVQWDFVEENVSETYSPKEEVSRKKSMLKSSSKASFAFKNPTFEFKHMIGKKKSWKSLKQIVGLERTSGASIYSSIDAPPSFKPAKKYADMSGLPAKYQDPHSGLRFNTAEEFAKIRTSPSDIITGYLMLRKAHVTT
ncbi:INO80 complex subunit C-like [Oscarella lobularis]|uniref:INO80 complex subunit C-like n=1 Tax=Oscarella lobularis TaxID=121494 RepID=UPI0033134B7F